MSYEIKKPITDKERADFIVKYNYEQGLNIEDTEMYLFALEENEIMGEKEIETEVIDPETEETHTEIITIPYPVENPAYPEIELTKAKALKVAENDTARDEALNAGVEYKGVLFDSDTDQKVNLLAIVSTMTTYPDGREDVVDEQNEDYISGEGSIPETITWFGKDNQPLECEKSDLIAIGGLITQLHSFCWNKNAQIKLLISEAQTVEDVNAIEIDYQESSFK